MEESIQSFKDICGVDVLTATSCLQAANFDLLRAVNEFMDGGRSQPQAAEANAIESWKTNANFTQSSGDEEDSVRAPIAPRREVMIQPGEDVFHRRKRPAVDQTVDPFRNFQREGALLEEEMGTLRLIRPKRDRLSDLYLPSRRITFHGSFLEAKDYATKLNKWLIVNLQSKIQFKSQLLNRDIWSHESVVECMVQSFVLWQVNHDTEDGARFKSFYGVEQCPYVCILDPRTGEAKAKYPKICSLSAFDVANDLLMFLNDNQEHPNMDILAEEVKPESSSDACSSSQPGPSRSYKSEKSFADSRPEKRKATSTEVTSKPSVQSSSSVEPKSKRLNAQSTFITNDAQHQSSKKLRVNKASKSLYVPSASLSEANYSETKPTEDTKTVEKTRLQIRFNDGQPPIVMSLSSATKMADLITMLKQHKLPEFYRLVCPFVAKSLSDLDGEVTVKQAGLHPTSVIHVLEDEVE